MRRWIDITLAGETLRLCAQGAIFAPRLQTLFVADPHLGKEATFRRQGIPVPQGSSAGTLDSIDQLLRETGAERLIILGDMFHAPSSLSNSVRRLLEDFFNRNSRLRLALVRGNHDTRIAPFPESWPVEIMAPGAWVGNIALDHHPGPLPSGAELLLCGHLHPAIRLRGDFGSLPCFWLSGGVLVLPAIGEFTGNYLISPAVEDRVWLVAEGEIIEQSGPKIRF